MRAENKAFRQELNTEKTEAAEERRIGSIEPLSPSKRKHRADSIDSMDSNRASLGSDDRTDAENPFADHEVGHATELMDMSMVMPEDVRSDQFQSPVDLGEGSGLPPSYSQAVADTASATLTPATLTIEEVDGNVEDADQGMSEALSSEQKENGPAVAAQATGEATEARGPEMQERARPPAFMTAPNGGAERGNNISTMDMEIPDHQA